MKSKSLFYKKDCARLIVLLVFFVIFVFSFSNLSFAETFKLKNGKQYSGEIIERAERWIKLETTDRVVKIPIKFMDDSSKAKLSESQSQAAPSFKEMDPDVNVLEILERVKETYAAMETFKAEGTVVTKIGMQDVSGAMSTTFSLLLKKPNLYLIPWKMNHVPNAKMSGLILPRGTASFEGAAWNDGTNPHLYVSFQKAYSKMESDERVLEMVSGMLGGSMYAAFQFFPSLFKEMPGALDQLKDVVFEGMEEIDGQDCYVLSGSSLFSKKETLWISKLNYLILRASRSLEPPEGGYAMPEVTDGQIEESMKAMGQEITDENKAKMRESMKQSMEIMKAMRLEGTVKIFYSNISSPQLTASDFQFTVPEGVEFKEFLFKEDPQAEYLEAQEKLDQAEDEINRFYALPEAAKASFNAGEKEKAKEYAEELLRLLPKYKDNWNFGNAIHDANMVLGRIAASEGNWDQAKQYLLLAGKAPGSAQISSFGPNMSLAKDLLEHGDTEVVLKYFNLCRRFWEMGDASLNVWEKAIKEGKVPDFGANLKY